MSQIKYQITFAVSGNHTISVSGDDKEALKEAVSWAKQVHTKLLATKQSDPQISNRSDQQQEAPVCAIHSTAMTWQQGKKGFFWSCHQKLPDGNWCPFKPQPRSQSVGATTPLPH
jgi:hypothetical protein